MVHCRIIGCKSRSERKEENITFHAFPKDLAVRNSWILSTGRLNWEPKKYDRICSRHFSENFIQQTLHRVYLNEFSVPTLYVHKALSDIKSTVCQMNMPIASTSAVLLAENTSKANIEMECETYSSSLTCKDSSTTKRPKLEIHSRSSEKNSETRGVYNKPTSEAEITPRKQKLIKKLNRQTLISQTRKKQLDILRSKNRRLFSFHHVSRFINQETADFLSSVHPDNAFFLNHRNNQIIINLRVLLITCDNWTSDTSVLPWPWLL